MATGSIKKTLTINEYTATGTTNANGMVVTSIPWSKNIIGAYASGSEGSYFALVRPSLTNSIVANIRSETSVVANTAVTIHIFKLE